MILGGEAIDGVVGVVGWGWRLPKGDAIQAEDAWALPEVAVAGNIGGFVAGEAKNEFGGKLPESPGTVTTMVVEVDGAGTREINS